MVHPRQGTATRRIIHRALEPIQKSGEYNKVVQREAEKVKEEDRLNRPRSAFRLENSVPSFVEAVDACGTMTCI